MPPEPLRFCACCLATSSKAASTSCESGCGEMLPLFDADGAMSVGFLAARGFCCDNGCRNCPYPGAESARVGFAGRVTEKTCPQCAKCFECRDSGCWCDGVRLAPAALARLRESCVGCLCPSCLSELASV